MTDPTGRSFLSYRRSALELATMIVHAQRERGIPTWQDVRDLAEEPSEEYISGVLKDPFTASAVLLVTPDVADSAFIKQVEVPLIQRRARNEDSFFMIPCAAGGLSYEEASLAVASNFSLEQQSRWNTVTIVKEPNGLEVAADVARRVLKRRLRAIHSSLEPEAPLRVRFCTRCEPAYESGTALTIDWSHRFSGRLSEGECWEESLIPALEDVVCEIRTSAPGRTVVAEGLSGIAAAVALGRTFMEPCGVPLAWRQYSPGGKTDLCPFKPTRSRIRSWFKLRVASSTRKTWPF